MRLLSLHNVFFLVDLAAQARAAIRAGHYGAWSREWLASFRSTRPTAA
jgi:queuine/archaeosine tRNA-ribosyltransferase